MIEIIIKQINELYPNKKVIFNTIFGEVTEKSRSFKLNEYENNTENIITLRLSEHENIIEVIHIDIMTVGKCAIMGKWYEYNR